MARKAATLDVTVRESKTWRMALDVLELAADALDDEATVDGDWRTDLHSRIEMLREQLIVELQTARNICESRAAASKSDAANDKRGAQ